MDKILNLFSSIPCDKLGHIVAVDCEDVMDDYTFENGEAFKPAPADPDYTFENGDKYTPEAINARENNNFDGNHEARQHGEAVYAASWAAKDAL